jgi:hypothetical protein
LQSELHRTAKGGAVQMDLFTARTGGITSKSSLLPSSPLRLGFASASAGAMPSALGGAVQFALLSANRSTLICFLQIKVELFTQAKL